jgi:hypothetical protein
MLHTTIHSPSIQSIQSIHSPPPSPPQNRTMTQDYYWEIHPTRPNQYARHWFEIEQARDREGTPLSWTPLPSCKDRACSFWSTCYDCNDCPATLLVDKAEFLARKELESEYEYEYEPTIHALLHPNAPFLYCHLTEPDDFVQVEREKDAIWRSTKSLRVSRIALALAWQDWFPESSKKNKEDYATVDQVRKELDYRRYRNHEHININRNIIIYHPEFNDKNKPVNEKKRDPDTQKELYARQPKNQEKKHTEET